MFLKRAKGLYTVYALNFVSRYLFIYTQAVLKFTKLNTQTQHREAVIQGRSLSPIPASV
ncbi:MAG: hypothetical protein LBJ00_13510 [Planctomycetaceae bacterium]|nr:hypothetical protein [Planctomycetaceae bacterium]